LSHSRTKRRDRGDGAVIGEDEEEGLGSRSKQRVSGFLPGCSVRVGRMRLDEDEDEGSGMDGVKPCGSLDTARAVTGGRARWIATKDGRNGR